MNVGKDDRAIHLGELGETLRGEVLVDREPAGNDAVGLGVADDDQPAGVGAQDPFESFA